MANKVYKSPRISSEFKDCALPLTGDYYTKCSFGCKYCFGIQFKKCNPAVKKSPELGIVNFKHLCDTIKGKYPDNPYYRNFYSKRFVLHFGGLTEPFCHLEKVKNVGLEVMKILLELKYPTLYSTKGVSLFLDDPKYRNIFEKATKSKNFAFQFSIVTNNDDISKIIEPNTPVTSERLKAMKILSDLNCYSILRLRPFIIGITDIELEELLTRAKNNGAKAISVEFFALDERVIPQLSDNLNIISKTIGLDIKSFYKKLSPRERGGYLRLNRDVKEIFMKRLYIKCKELGLLFCVSDPDYKELGESGCCCGLPEEFYDNPELTNWSRGQITYHLKELRKRYWESNGVDKYLKFDMIKKDIFNNWADEYKYSSDSIKFWQSDYSRLNTGHIREFIESWNNLRSPDNPYNHYQNILVPDHIEDNKIVYRYNPQEYETRWMKEGVL